MLAGMAPLAYRLTGRLGGLEADTSSPCGLLVPTQGHWPLANGGPALGPCNTFHDCEHHG